MRLSKHAGLDVDERDAKLLRDLSEYYVQSRYPGDVDKDFAEVSLEVARDILSQTEAVSKWLSALT